MRQFRTIGLTVALCFGVVTVWFGNEVSAAHCNAKAGAACKVEMECVKGKLKSIDAEACSAVVTVGEGEGAKDVTVKVCPKAKVKINGEEKALADVKAGDEVCLCCTKTKDGALVARRVVVGEVCKVPGGKCTK